MQVKELCTFSPFSPVCKNFQPYNFLCVSFSCYFHRIRIHHLISAFFGIPILKLCDKKLVRVLLAFLQTYKPNVHKTAKKIFYINVSQNPILQLSEKLKLFGDKEQKLSSGWWQGTESFSWLMERNRNLNLVGGKEQKL